ncbi:hypothetical protein ACETK8_11010 [Brevundimonas staleyi]|uniref:Type IV toxin-antitoxin system AbiEi family antitoxin domain-containing protein n=1 Tax=Brevundimonas staleyi TaxID=74326 RepID=A0ABW0FRE8_9CAUL|nr:hypothetical protein [Brevundimonas diminuta]MDM8354076.1 hypothetical protein [Brevundimonas diminuta]
MSALDDLRRQLRPGEVYRRRDLAKGSSALDRHVRRLVVEGHLEKVSHGPYMAPRQSRFGRAPARPEKLIKAFLKDDRFLMMSPSAFNGLGVGTTQLYNESIVYNLRRQGRFELGGLTYDFRRTPSVPSGLNAEVLLVALLLGMHRLAEDRTELVPRVLERARALDPDRLAQAASVRLGEGLPVTEPGARDALIAAALRQRWAWRARNRSGRDYTCTFSLTGFWSRPK